MILKQLSILNYKNLQEVELELSPKINCFLGNNGMGKTNLLDAVYYLSFCKSHTNAVDSQNIRHDADMCMIKAIYEFENGNIEDISCGLRRRQKKQFRRNKKEYEKLSDHIGLLPLVMISPADNELITGGSEARRRFIDLALSQFDKGHLNSLIKYGKALQQRNAILKNDPSKIDDTLLELWEEIMVEEGVLIHSKRKDFIEQFTPIFNNSYLQISGSTEKVSVEYKSQLSEGDYSEKLRDSRRRDIMLGYSNVGIHRDDLEMNLDGYPIKRVGSQGQNKTYMISLKLAQFHYLLQIGKRRPILLLDDIFDRLDSSRVEEIIKMVSGDEFGQIFMSDTNRQYLDRMVSHMGDNNSIYIVENGSVSPLIISDSKKED